MVEAAPPPRTGRGSPRRSGEHLTVELVARPPTVNPEYMAPTKGRSNAAQGPRSCGNRNSGCLWKSGSSPLPHGCCSGPVWRPGFRRNTQGGFHLLDLLPAVDELDQRQFRPLQMSLVDDEIGGCRADPSRSPTSAMVRVLADEAIAQLVDDDPGEQDSRRNTGAVMKA